MKKLLFTLLLAAVTLPGWAEKYPSVLHVAGNATTAGWLTGTSTLLYQVSEKKYEGFISFTGTADGEVKFLCQSGWQDHWGPSSNGTAVSGNGTFGLSFCSGGNPDNKFKPTISGLYLVTVDVTTEGNETATFKQWDTTSDVYEIGTAKQLSAYADCINKFDQSVKANLTADIDMTGVTGWTPIGQDGKDFKGQFNGQGHRIKSLTTTAGYNNQALFGQAVGGAIIENVIIDASCTIQGAKYTAGILGHVWGDGVIVRNCGNEANVTGTEPNAAGIVGCSEKKVIIQNCYNTGHITGSKESAAICAWMGDNASSIENCFNIGAVTGQDGNNRMYRKNVSATNLYDIDGQQGTQFTNEQLASGELCYKLNGSQSNISWYQTLGEGGDAHPVPFSAGGHSQVYANGEMKCDGTAVEGGTLTYSNTSTSTIPDHQYENGFCKVCDKYQENAFAATDGWYVVSEPWQLRWLAVSVNEHNSTYGNANIKLTADIDYRAYTDQAAMFGKPSNTFRGVFDGQCHTVTVAFENNTADETGLFRRINGGTVKNLKVAGSITTNQKLAAGICSGIWQKGIIQNCESAVTITDEGSGDATHGGILARVSDKSNTNGGIQVLNCLFSGTLNAPNRTGSGGIIGWPDDAVSEVKVYNCLVTGAITLKDDNNNDLIVRNTAEVKNCYYSSTLTNNLRNSKNAIAVVSTEIATGELCYKLNEQVSGAEKWYQNLPGSVDVLPTPFYTSAKVYANGNFQCDGITPKPGSETTYSNAEGANIEEHSFENHLCSVCKAVGQEPSATDGVYQIEDIGHLIWFAAHVNEGSATASGKLTADITQNDAVYIPIGSSMNPYHGTFDGDYHTVTLNLTDESKSNQGIFGVLTGGATINNIIAAGIVKGYSGVGGIAGSTNGGGDVTFICCGNEAAITASHANAGGILGVDMASAAAITMKNVYSTGAISGGTDNGGLSGWAGNKPYIINAYCISEVSGNNSSQFIRNNDGTVNFKNTFGNDQITGTMLTDGTLCAKLGDAFHQTIGIGHPELNPSLPNVYEIAVTDAGYATFVPKKNIAAIPEGVTAYAAQKVKTWLNLEEVSQLPADNAVIVKANAGSYYCNSTEEARTLGKDNELTFSDTEIDADGSQYILAKPEGAEKAGFYQATSGKIAARKAYITSTSGVKAFFFDGDDATSINEELRMKNEESSIFNIAGQKLTKMQKGINIVNGKKILK